MKNYYLRLSKVAFAIFIFTLSLNAQRGDNFWKLVNRLKAESSEQIFRKSAAYQAYYYQLDLAAIRLALQNAPQRLNSTLNSSLIITLPNASGGLDNYKIMEANVFHEGLQAKYPSIKSYVGQGVDNPELYVRFSISSFGLHSMTLGGNVGTQFIDPFSKQGEIYIVYTKRNLSALENPHRCEVEDEMEGLNSPEILDLEQARNANDGRLRRYRLALACTEEYSAFHVNRAGLNSAPDSQKKAAVLAAMNVTMTRVNGIYERDLSLTMTIVPNNDIIIFLNNDPFDNNDAGVLINQSQTVIDSNIGNANYDIGHTFSTGVGGLAQLNSPCVVGQKARGITGLPQPVGDPFDIDFVAHEMGHQFGSPHTFNGNVGNCGSPGQRSGTSAYEPGSGSTIMAYAGICGNQNVQNLSDSYFHQRSLQLIWANISTGNSSTCPIQTVTGNSTPTANAGPNYTIPVGTPYKLTGTSTDADGISTHTYTWEQYDLGPAAGIPSETATEGPLVRSFEGTTNPTRYVPRLSDVLQNGGISTTWEKLSLVNRSINYKLTVRDNDSRGGQIAVDDMTITTNNNASFFSVTSQNTSGITWTPGETETITWNVGGTNNAPINTQNVNILLSIDGGQNFDIVLASNTPNDGSQAIVVPDVFGVNCRVMVEAVGNIFFNVNSQSFLVGSLICNDYNSEENLDLAIPDGLGTTSAQAGPAIFSQINISDNVTIEQLSLSVDITHTYVGDLLIQLVHPNNINFVDVWVNNCGSNENIVVTFQDGAPTINCGSPTSGRYNPVNPLSAFNGLSTQGIWTISIIDFFTEDIGTLNSWGLEICNAAPSPVTNNCIENLQVYPNPNNGIFTISFAPQSEEDIKLQVYDIRGRAIFNQIYESNCRFEETLTLEKVQSGIYLLSISYGNQKVTKKIIIN